MSNNHRLAAERAFHDRQAAERLADLTELSSLRFRDDRYLGHETWIRPAFAKLGDVAGRHILDLGCGHAMASVVLARRGAYVTAVDLSVGYLAEARRRAAANEVAIEFVEADAQRLPFPDASFDAIWANAVLHHLDLRLAAAELSRVLRPGGVAVCCEPLGGNPLLTFGRRWLPYPGKGRTRDEEPLHPSDIAILRERFPRLTIEGHQLFSMIRRIMGAGRLTSVLERLDDRLLKCSPSLWRFCRYLVLTLPR